MESTPKPNKDVNQSGEFVQIDLFPGLSGEPSSEDILKHMDVRKPLGDPVLVTSAKKQEVAAVAPGKIDPEIKDLQEEKEHYEKKIKELKYDVAHLDQNTIDKYTKSIENIDGKIKKIRQENQEFLEGKKERAPKSTSDATTTVPTPSSAPRQVAVEPSTVVDPEVVSPSASPESEPEPTQLSPVNRERFARMPRGAKNIFEKAHEGLFDIPGVNRVVGKLEIAYKQFWSDKHQEKSATLKSKMDALDEQIRVIEQTKNEIKANVNELRSQNIPGGESLEVAIAKCSRQQEALMKKKDRFQTKLEARDNKVRMYTNERDMIAEKLIGRYEEKLKPMEKGLERLDASKNKLDLEAAVAEVKYRELGEKVTTLEAQIARQEDIYTRTGVSASGVLKILKTQIAENYKKIREGKNDFNRRYNEIHKEIAKLNKKANPYRDKRAEFVLIKDRRPLDMNIQTRNSLKEYEGREDVTGTTRAYVGTPALPVETRSQSSPERVDNYTFEVRSLAGKWNTYLQETYGNSSQGVLLTMQDFENTVGLRADKKLLAKEFKNILSAYYKSRKLLTPETKEAVDKFF